jgi:hypothetical protein
MMSSLFGGKHAGASDNEDIGLKLAIAATVLLGLGLLASTPEQRARSRRRAQPLSEVFLGLSMLAPALVLLR